MHPIIQTTKDQLQKKANKEGLTENFGQKEIRKLYDHKLANPFGTKEERQFHREVQQLDEWLMNFGG